DGKRVIMTFEGEKHFTLIEEKRTAAPALSEPKEVEGDIVNLGHSIGVLGDNAIEWSADGIYFYLASEELTKEELIDVAQSVQGKDINLHLFSNHAHNKRRSAFIFINLPMKTVDMKSGNWE